MEVAQYVIALERPILQPHADNHDVGLVLVQQADESIVGHGGRNHFDAACPRTKCALHQLAIQLVCFSNDDSNGRAPGPLSFFLAALGVWKGLRDSIRLWQTNSRTK